MLQIPRHLPQEMRPGTRDGELDEKRHGGNLIREALRRDHFGKPSVIGPMAQVRR